MHCEEAEGLLARLVYDELDELDAELGEGTAEKLRAHVESCDACRERAGDMRVAAKLLKDGVELETPVLSPERKERLERETARAETAASGAGGGRRRIAFWIVTASAAVLLVGFFLSTLFMTVGMAPKMMLMEGLSGDDEGHIFRGEPEPAGEEFASRTLYDSVSGAAGGGAAPGSDEGDATGVGDRIADTNETWGGTQALEFDDSGNWNVPQTVTVTGKRASGPAPTGYDGQARFDPFEDGGPGELRLPQTVQRTVVTKRPGGDLRPDGLDLGIVGRKTAGGKTADGSFTYTPSSGFAAEEAKTYAYSTGDAAKPPPRTVSAWHRGMWHHGTATPESLSRDHEISGRAYEPVAVAPAGGAVTSEAGGEARFDVWLNAQPTSRDLTVAVTNGLVTTEAGGGAEAPVVFSVTPAEGPTQGGTGVVVTGDSFEKGARVAFGRGDRPASSASTGEPYAWSPNTRDPFFGGATYAEGPAETPPPPPAKPAGRAVAVNGEVASGLVAQWKFDDDGDAPRDTAGSGAPGGRASGRMTVPDDETRVTGGLRRQRGEGEKDEGAASRLAMARTSADKDVRAFEPNVGWVDRWGPDFTDLYEAKPGAAPAPKEPAAGPGAASSSRPAKTPQAAGAAVDLKSGGAVRGRLAYEWRNGGAVEVTTPEGATVRVPASEIAGVKRPSRKVRIPDQIDHPVIVHEEPEEFDHMQTENNMDADTARGQEDAISDIPLAGTGVAGGPGVGGGGSGAPARPKPDRRHRIILDQQRAIEVAKEKAQAAVAERKRYENRLNERAKPAKRKPPTSRPARARGRLNVNRGDGLAKQLDELAPPDEGARKAAPEAAKAEAKELIARAQSMMQARDGRGLESAERMLESALRKYSGTAAGKESEKRIAEARKRVAELRRKRAEDARRGAARDAKLAEGRDTYKRAAAAAFAEGGALPPG